MDKAAPAAQRDVKRPGQVPKDEGEGHRLHDIREQAERKVECLRRKEIEVLGYALVGIVGAVPGQLETIVGLVAEPFLQIDVGHPSAPANLQHLLQIGPVDQQKDVGAGEHGEQAELIEERGFVVILQRVVEIVAPGVEPDVDPYLREVHRQDGGEQAARQPPLLGEPVRAGDAPCLFQHAEPCTLHIAVLRSWGRRFNRADGRPCGVGRYLRGCWSWPSAAAQRAVDRGQGLPPRGW